MKFLIVMVACNEAPSIDSFLPKLRAVLSGLEDSGEVLVVDDGSEDKTAAIARKHKCVVLRNSKNSGIGFSLRRGYRYAVRQNYDLVVTMDADGQHDPNFLEGMLSEIRCGRDIVVASRYHRDSERIGVPVDRDLLNVAVTAQMRIVTGWDLTDPLCGFWVMRRSCFEFALKHGRQARYGTHIEHLIKFWYLAEPRPNFVQVAHPAIYGNHGTRELLTRAYSPSNREARIDRFGTHALHIVEAIEDVERHRPGVVAEEMAARRK